MIYSIISRGVELCSARTRARVCRKCTHTLSLARVVIVAETGRGTTIKEKNI